MIGDSIEYNMIKTEYGDKITKRSDVKLINHIDEGLIILDKINAKELAKKAYCIHPIFQGDRELSIVYDIGEVAISPIVCILVMEYRSIANAYLSKRKINSINEIKLSPIKDVNDMLIADKIQNYKDFMLYHFDTHPRSKELYEYFHNWFIRLGLNLIQVDELVKLIS